MIEQADLDFVGITWSVTPGYCLVHDRASASGRSVDGSYGDAVRADEDKARAGA